LAVAANNLAGLYRNADRPDLARDLLYEVVACAPELPEARLNLGNALLKTHDYEAAFDAYEAAVRLRPDYPKALMYLAHAGCLTLRLERCLELLRHVAERDGVACAHSLLIYFGMFSPDLSAEQLAALADAWATRFAAPWHGATPRFDVSRDPARPLRVGYVSPNFCNHSIGVMVEAILA